MVLKFSKFHYLILGLILLNGVQGLQLIVSDVHSTENNCQDYSDLVMLDMLPVDVDDLFWADNLTKQNEILTEIETGDAGWILSPWGGYFISGHIEGADKWYLNTRRILPIVAPITGTIISVFYTQGAIGSYNGTEIIYECHVEINIGNDCSILMGHVDLLKSIYDEFQAEGSYSILKGEIFAYVHEFDPTNIGTEIYYLSKYGNICPINALQPTLKTKVENYYALQYNRAKLSGRYPQSSICTDMNIHIENTFWGVWKYDSGPFDAYYEEIDDFGALAPSFLTLFNINFTNPETYWKDLGNPSNNISEDVIGLYGDNSGAQDVPGYKELAKGRLILLDGNYNSGILNMSLFWGSDHLPEGGSLYARFQLTNNAARYQDDLLNIECFDTYTEAQTGFTSNKIIYSRYLENTECDFTETSGLSILIINLIAILGFIPIILIRRNE